MKKWLTSNKWKIVISSVAVLLPVLFGIIFWNELPDMMVTHWGADQVPDGMSGKGVAVFALPITMLILHLVCIFATTFDKHNRDQNRKVIDLCFWIMPILSLAVNGMMYATAFEQNLNMIALLPVLLGVLMTVIGNYMPKAKQNRTFGIKIDWTFGNEENWNKTHRFTGRLWVIGGLLMIATAFMPAKWMFAILLADVLVMCLVPIVYSYSIYRSHKKRGIEYHDIPASKSEKVAIKSTLIILAILLPALAIIMFTGDVTCDVTDSAIIVDASYGSAITVNFDAIDSVEYRENLDFGARTWGFGSARLLVGTFQNEEFGTYTLYAYTCSDEGVVIKSGDKVLVISGKNEQETKALYNEINSKLK